MHTFTLIANFRGGTYISQVESESVENCISSWLNRLKEELTEIQYLGKRTLSELENSTEEFSPGALRGLRNAWCDVLLTKQGAIHLNIVKTV